MVIFRSPAGTSMYKIWERAKLPLLQYYNLCLSLFPTVKRSSIKVWARKNYFLVHKEKCCKTVPSVMILTSWVLENTTLYLLNLMFTGCLCTNNSFWEDFTIKLSWEQIAFCMFLIFQKSDVFFLSRQSHWFQIATTGPFIHLVPNCVF